MGTYKNKKFRYVGKIGTGFNANKLKEVIARLKPLETKESPFQISNPKAKGIHWVKPELTAEVEFRDVTKDGMVRQGSFQGLREDKKSTDVIFEKPPSHLKKPEFKITHPDRVLYKKDKITKLDVANYYKSVSAWLLPLVVNRPLSFVRCPKESGKTCFYQKHLDTTQLNQLSESEIRNQKVNYIESEEGLLQLAQWGVLELHCWQTHIEHRDHPDQIVFDFDPDESVPWKQVIKGVVRLKEVLDQLKLKSFLKATGGKGLHVHVPIAPIYTWEETKEFSKTITQLLENESPNLYTTNTLKKVRKGKIFLDYLRNGYGATAIAPYSLRAKETPVVALPLFWDELKKIKSSSQFLMMDVLKILLQRKEDPWKDFLKTKQKIKVLSQRK
jgi:bifunctional non-homologous end joining protein LigD